MVFLEISLNFQEHHFVDKVAGLRHATLLKKKLWDRLFSCEFCEISKSTFSYRTLPVAASVKATQLTTKLIAITQAINCLKKMFT